MINRLEKLGVQMIQVDLSNRDQALFDDLARADRASIPVNLIYPPDYPSRPAILLEELVSPSQLIEALDRITLKQAADSD